VKVWNFEYAGFGFSVQPNEAKGGVVTLFNPGLETTVSDAIGLPVTSAVSSARVAASAKHKRWVPGH
jgi:hypothetical protein